jgi:hypothetical protein
MNGKKIWFPAKKYGWGWGLPTCWQGWVVMAVWLVALTAGIPLALHGHHFFFIAYTILLAAILILICWLKGEKPRWRWGKD